VAGRFFSAQGYKAKGHFGFGMRVVSGTKWVAERLLWVPRRDAGVGVIHASLHHPSVVGRRHDASICFGGTSVLSLQCLRTLTLGKSLSMVAQW
jgi:hypothetical protein